MILASLADMIAFVVRHNENDKELIRRCVSNVRRINPNIIGAVLNNIDLDRSHYKDYYYVGYYYYGDSATKKGRKSRGASGTTLTALDSDVDQKAKRSVG